MSTKILYLFPDTNLFVQCRPLCTLDWVHWKDFDEIHLIVSRPVQSEIDHQKSRGNDRLGSKARSTAKMFRNIIRSTDKYSLIRDKNPPVKVYVELQFKYSPELSAQLNYNERDDQLVGTVHTFIKEHPDEDVRLLTHDSGPMASADMLGIRAEEIPDDWLLSPEKSEAEKRVSVLEKELAHLKSCEPSISITCLDGNDKEVTRLEIEMPQYVALTDDEVSALMARITSLFPIATDFGLGGEDKSRLLKYSMFGQVFRPVTNAQITTYQEEKYPGWLKKCEQSLRTCHEVLKDLSAWPTFCFKACNKGTRPAKDALITIEAKGNFMIMPFDDGNEDADNDKNKSHKLRLPLPPKAPQGHWEQRWLKKTLPTMPISDFVISAPFSLPLSSHHLNLRRNPNAFHWKPHRPVTPGRLFCFECEQWRHGVEAETFGGLIFFDKDQEKIAGLLECRISAENLSEIVRLPICVRINSKLITVYETAMSMVDQLISRESSSDAAISDP